MNELDIQQTLAEFASPDPAQRVAALRQIRDYLRVPRHDERITTALIPLLRDLTECAAAERASARSQRRSAGGRAAAGNAAR